MSGIGLISSSPTNVWRERGYQDGLQRRKTRVAQVREQFGQAASMAYAVGFRRGKEAREGMAR